MDLWDELKGQMRTGYLKSVIVVKNDLTGRTTGMFVYNLNGKGY